MTIREELALATIFREMLALATIFREIATERRRQDQLFQEGKFGNQHSATWEISDSEKLATLAEEFGEVARHVSDGINFPERRNWSELRKELIEVAAVCVVWCESLP